MRFVCVCVILLEFWEYPTLVHFKMSLASPPHPTPPSPPLFPPAQEGEFGSETLCPSQQGLDTTLSS